MNTGSPPTIFVYQAEDQRVGEEDGWARSNSRGCTCEFVFSASRLPTLFLLIVPTITTRECAGWGGFCLERARPRCERYLSVSSTDF